MNPEIDFFMAHLMTDYPILAAEEQKALARQAKVGDPTAREKLVMHNLRLVVKAMQRFSWIVQGYDDAIQEGIAGLIHAIDLYDPERGALSTYALWWIRQSIQIWLFNQSRVYLPRYLHETVMRLRRHRQACTGKSTGEIAHLIDMPESHVRAALTYIDVRYLSLDAPLPDDEDGFVTLATALSDEEDEYATVDEEDEKKRRVLPLLSVLTKSERDVVRWRFGMGCREMSEAEISAGKGVTRQSVNQTYNRAMQKMQAVAALENIQEAI